MAADRGQSTRSRAVQVCLTCKSRKKKCDKVVPRCGYCIRKGLDCFYSVHPRRQSPALPASPASALSSSSSSSSSSREKNHYSSSATAASSITTPSSPPQWILPSAVRQPVLPRAPAPLQTAVFQEVLRAVRAAGRFVDDVTAAYFRRGAHRFLPLIARTRFHDDAVTLGGAPAVDLSVLLLAIFVIGPDGYSCILLARSLFAQAQAQTQTRAGLPPSVRLVQAGLLLALAEYAHGRPDDALGLVAVCARMAWSAGLHTAALGGSGSGRKSNSGSANDVICSLEAANTWWAVVICERIILCEATVPGQQPISPRPAADWPLPVEPQVMERIGGLGGEGEEGRIEEEEEEGQGEGGQEGRQGHEPEQSSSSRFRPRIAVSDLDAPDIGGFGRFAQAVMLLDSVMLPAASFPSSFPPSSQPPAVDGLDLDHLRHTDRVLQRFLAATMARRHGAWCPWGTYCAAIATGFRAMFVLHRRVLAALPSESLGSLPSLGPPSPLRQTSLAALDAVVHMVVDVAESYETIPRHMLGVLPLNNTYLYHTTLHHVRTYGRAAVGSGAHSTSKNDGSDDGNDDDDDDDDDNSVWRSEAEAHLLSGLAFCELRWRADGVGDE